MGVKERLIEFLAFKKLSQGKFQKITGLANGFVNNIGKSIRGDSLDKITVVFPELSSSWLMLNEGDMIKTKSEYVKTEEIFDSTINDKDLPCEKCKELQIKLNVKITRVDELLEQNLNLSEELKEIYKKYPQIPRPHQPIKAKAG